MGHLMAALSLAGAGFSEVAALLYGYDSNRAALGIDVLATQRKLHTSIAGMFALLLEAVRHLVIGLSPSDSGN
jgi:hypothetical protein